MIYMPRKVIRNFFENYIRAAGHGTDIRVCGGTDFHPRPMLISRPESKAPKP